VLSNPQHPYTRALLSVVPEMHGVEQIVLSGETPDPTKIPSGCRFHPRCQELRNGVAENAGIAAACQSISPLKLSAEIPVGLTDVPHSAACHLVTRPPTQ
jgi:peptide/nickel transport system ATP-binding protein